MTDNALQRVRFELETNHPVLAAMATQLTRTETGIHLTFDGPSLPEKRHAELRVQTGPLPEDWRLCIEPWLIACERDVAAAMKSAGYSGRFVQGQGGAGPSAEYGTTAAALEFRGGGGCGGNGGVHEPGSLRVRISSEEREAICRWLEYDDRGTNATAGGLADQIRNGTHLRPETDDETQQHPGGAQRVMSGIEITIHDPPEGMTLREIAQAVSALKPDRVWVDCAGIGQSILGALRYLHGIDVRPLPKGRASLLSGGGAR